MSPDRRAWTTEEIEAKVKKILSDSLNVPVEEIDRSSKLVDLMGDTASTCPCFLR